jgi:type VI secretion system protein ImpF
MPEEISKDRLQPSLLDRLTDHKPDETVEDQDHRVLTRQQLKEAVLRDLTWLFSTTRAEPEAGAKQQAQASSWEGMTHARTSVLNYGLPAFPGIIKSGLSRNAMESAIRQAISIFEPRIDPKTVQVEIQAGGRMQFNSLQLTIRGDLWSKPEPTVLLMTTALDLESGHTRVREFTK